MSAGQITQGRRIYPEPSGKLRFDLPGDYGKDFAGKWMCRLPNWGENAAALRIGVELNHTVTEHEDGTITVSPSILWDVACMPAYPESWWHGFLERGVWREV